jgi:hypothetical protein
MIEEGKYVCIKNMASECLYKGCQYTITRTLRYGVYKWLHIFNMKGENLCNFQIGSEFHTNILPEYLVSIKEQRKEKLQKLNDIYL